MSTTPSCRALIDIIEKLTVPCADDGDTFTQVDRLNLIRSALASRGRYRSWADLPLAKLFAHERFEDHRPFVLVSCHIDSVYKRKWYYAKEKDKGEKGELWGTFDNSACNALLLHAMMFDKLPPQVLVAFTGNEERKMRGVKRTVKHLADHGAFWNLELVVTLDVTEECYGKHDITIENIFVESRNSRSKMRFSGKGELRKKLEGLLHEPHVIKNGAQDEAWEYDECDLNCFSLCLPCRAIREDIHEKEGVAIRTNSLLPYYNTFIDLVTKVAALLNRAAPPVTWDFLEDCPTSDDDAS